MFYSHDDWALWDVRKFTTATSTVTLRQNRTLTVRTNLSPFYSTMGRHSIDPKLKMRLLVTG